MGLPMYVLKILEKTYLDFRYHFWKQRVASTQTLKNSSCIFAVEI